MREYADHPMDFADASLVAAAEILRATSVFTLDRTSPRLAAPARRPHSMRGLNTLKAGHRPFGRPVCAQMGATCSAESDSEVYVANEKA